MIAVDTNALVYAHQAEMDLHTSAADRLTALAEGDECWALRVLCITEFSSRRDPFEGLQFTIYGDRSTGFVDELLASPTL